MKRRLLTGLCIFAVVGLTVLMALPWVDVLVGNVVPVLQALTPVSILVVGLVTLGALVTRRRRAVLAMIPALVLSLLATGLLLRPLTEQGTGGPRHLTVLSLNAEFGGADADAVMRLVRERKPDVVVFVEMTKAKLSALDARGLSGLVPHRTSGMIDDGSRGSVVLSRFPVTTVDADSHLGPDDLQCPVARVSAPGAPVLVRAVHTYPPLQDGVAQWRPQLQRLGSWQRQQPDAHLVMAGDFNAGVVHPAFRKAAGGLLDAVATQRSAWWPSWPHGSWVPPFVQIDHILTRGFAVRAGGAATVPGTDHAGVWADLTY